jgi:hypothetical protein
MSQTSALQQFWADADQPAGLASIYLSTEIGFPFERLRLFRQIVIQLARRTTNSLAASFPDNAPILGRLRRMTAFLRK